MVIEAVFTLLILFFLTAYYRCFYQPRRAIKWYQNTLESLGYKVGAYQYKPFGSSYFSQLMLGSKEKGDPEHYLKKDFPGKDVYIANLLNTPILFLINPDLINIFLSSQNVQMFQKDKMIIGNIQRSLGKGIAFSEGNEWKRKRKIISYVFNYNFLINQIPKIINLFDQNVQRIEKQYKAKHEDHEEGVFNYEILELWTCMFSNVMMQCFFGVSSTYEKIQGKIISLFLNQLNTEITKQSTDILGMLFGTKFLNLGIRANDRKINRKIKILEAFAKDLIEKRVEELKKSEPKENYTDIIEALSFHKMLKKDEKKSRKTDEYDYDELIDQFRTFYTAGTDTSSHLLTMMIYYIILHPKIEKRLRQEINSVIHDDSDITIANLKELTYIDWIQFETTRFYGPGNGIFFRKPNQDTYISNIPILKDTFINIGVTGNHFDEKYFPNPFEFRPERWQKQCDNLHSHAFVGFSGGPRSCIGKHLAMLETKISLIKFIKRYAVMKLPKADFKMQANFLIDPEPMDTHLRYKE